MAESLFELDARKFNRVMNSYPRLVRLYLKRGMLKAAMGAAENIKSTFKGGGGLGFNDQTGKLRNSIVGGLKPDTNDAVYGFIGAGDDRIGSNGKPTREYVKMVEFSEFRRSPKNETAFLRPGALMNRSFMRKVIMSEISKGLK